jgi:pyruvate/2-oxoglutarate dehydrogenase complex dihydrolipoamide acyltransferase (E2) component
MTANRLLLLLNSLLLLLILGQRTQAEGGHLGWLQALPWSSFGTELADLSSQAQISAGAVLCLWLVLSAGWLLISFMVERQQRRAAAAQANTPGEAPAAQTHAANAPAAHASSEPAFQTAFQSAGASAMAHGSAEPSLHAREMHARETDTAADHAAAHASAHASNGAAAPHAGDPAHGDPNINMEDDASIQQVLARLQKNVPDLSPEARAELARLRAALQTLSDPETKS